MRVVTAEGQVIELGATEETPTIGIVDYSRRETDDFGVTTVVERGYSRRMSVRMAVPFGDADRVQLVLADLRATAARWVADDRFGALNFQGFYKEFELDLNVPPLSWCTLTVEGLAASEPFVDPGGDPAPDEAASTLHLLQPVDVAGAMLTASTVPENDYPEWSAGVTYPKSARVISTATHRAYEAIVLGSTGHDPAGGHLDWLDIGPTNRWAMFDQALGTATTAEGAIEVTIAAGAVNAVAVLDIVGATVRVRRNGYDRTVAVTGAAMSFLDLPDTSSAVTVTIAGPGALSIGTLMVGRVVGLGITEASPTAGITDYSRKEVDAFGEVTVVQRAWAKRMSAKALIRTDAVDLVANRIAAVRARPSLWIGQAGIDSLTIYGFFKEFSIEVGPAVSKLALSIEGLSKAAKVDPLQVPIDWPDVGDSDGTKPENNATVGAPTGTIVGDRSAEQLIADLTINTGSIVAQALRQEDAQIVLNARTLVEGQPVATKFLEFRNAQETANSATATILSLLGAKTPEGSGWILNLETVRIAEGTTLAQKFTEIGAATGNVNSGLAGLANTVSGLGGQLSDTSGALLGLAGSVAQQGGTIQRLDEVLTGASGTTARSLLALNVDGNVSGLINTNNGTTSSFVIVANKFALVDPNGGSPFIPLSYSGGVWKMSNVEIDTLKAGSIVTDTIAVNQVTGKSFWQVNWGGLNGTTLGAASEKVWGQLGQSGNKAIVSPKGGAIPIGTEVCIRMYINLQRTGSNNDRVWFRLRRDGISTTSVVLGDVVRAGMGDYPTIVTYEWQDIVPSSDTYTYSLEYYRDAGEGNYFTGKLVCDLGKR